MNGHERKAYGHGEAEEKRIASPINLCNFMITILLTDRRAVEKLALSLPQLASSKTHHVPKR
jgi:hypothetical protein